ncbi:N-alpha-acetyltransferase 25, NatB auxiliary subunit [Kappamyces sp. JEL0680]|nr:N-alpha-acetyltransferase 25, NatB auxiliary subunit [Kappamyces sp. JEL0680]
MNSQIYKYKKSLTFEHPMQRLAPIYDAIDNEKYSLAMKICDKAMSNKGDPDYQTLKALKALALCRSGLYQQAYDLAYEVKMTKPTDAPTLQAVFMTFKMLHMCKESSAKGRR